MPTLPDLALSEKRFQQMVTDLANLRGWLFYHPWNSQKSTPGWPDCAMVRPPRFVVAELKSEKGRLSPHQREWLDKLQQVPTIEVFVWRPRDWEEILRVLE